MADENTQTQDAQSQQLGTNVVYTDPDNTRRPVSVGGVTFVPDRSVDLTRYLDEGQAKRLAKRLAGNPYFQVEGGPDHEEERRRREEAAREQQALLQATAERQYYGDDERRDLPPEGYEPPNGGGLETPTATRSPARTKRR